MISGIITDPWFWALAIPAVTINGVSKAGLGGGAGGVAVPLIALVLSPVQAAAIMLPVLCVMDLAGLKAYFGRWEPRIMRIIVPAGVLGCLAGTFTFRYLNDSLMRILLGTIALGYLAYSLAPRREREGAPPPSAWQGRFWGALSGFTSFVSHAGGPPLLVYLLPQKLEKVVFVATSMVFFAALNYAKIIPYLWLGLFDSRNLMTSLALVPVGVAGVYLGVWLQQRISAELFYRIIRVLLFATGSKLLFDGLRGL